MFRFVSILALAVLSLNPGPAPCQEASKDSIQAAADALRAGNAEAAAEISTRLLDRLSDPDPSALWIRAHARELLEDYAGALEDLRRLVQIEEPQPRTLVALGEAAFKAAHMAASIAAFDAAVEAEDRIGPHLWQRGISAYYAERFEDGARQFEVHRTVNPQDVENSVWHFLCVAAVEGFETARSGLIPVDSDSRVPMAQVFDLFRGTGSVEQVLEAAARARASGQRGSADLYAHLYLGLYYEARGEAMLSAREIDKAVRTRQPRHYMWQVARIHQQMRTRER